MGITDNLATGGQSPKQGFPKSLVIFIPLIAVIIIAGALIYFFDFKKDNKVQVPQNKEETTSASRRTNLLDFSKLVFPEYTLSSKELSLTQLPPELKPFILDGASNISIRNISYKSSTPASTVGYHVSYHLPDSDLLVLTSMFYAILDKWKIASGARNDTLGLLEVTKNDLQLQINYKKTGSTEIQVELLMTPIIK